MKLGIVCESDADAAAIHILVDAILDTKSELVAELVQRTGGWKAVMRTLPAQIRAFHYGSDIDGVVVVVDSDESPLHRSEHELGNSPVEGCRLCKLIQLANQELERLGPRPYGSPLKVAFGVACPALEAWLLYGQLSYTQHNSEVAWQQELRRSSSLKGHRDQMKRDLYGKVHVGLSDQMTEAVKAAHVLASRLTELERDFPLGFGPLAQSIRSWI